MLHIVSDKFHVVWTSKDCEDLLVSSHNDYEQALNAADNLIQDPYSTDSFLRVMFVSLNLTHSTNNYGLSITT